MLPEAIAIGIAKVLTGQLLDGVELQSGIRKVLQVPVDQIFGGVERSVGKKTIDKLAKAVAGELLAFPGALEENAGAARAAADTFLDALRSSELSASRMVDLSLDPVRIEEYVLNRAKAHLEGASAERRGHVGRAVAQLSKLLVANAADLPGVQVAFMQAMLQARGGNEA